MRELERRVQRDLDRIADQAPRSSEASHAQAWEGLRRRLDAEPDRIDEEVIMLAPADPPSRRPRWTTAVAVAVAAVAALVVAGVVVLRSGDDTSTVVDAPVTTLDPEPETDPEPSPDVDGQDDAQVEGHDVDWQYGASLPGQLRQVVSWSEGLAAILDADGDDNGRGGEVWYSSDGVEWTHLLDPFGPDDDVYLLAGQQGALFALAGDPDDPATLQTLWHRPAGAPWAELITSEGLDHMAVGPERLVAYAEEGFEIVGVFDTATLAPVEFTGIPELVVEPGATGDPTGGESGEAFEPQLLEGGALALDDGFLAEVVWVVGVDDGEPVRERRLMYSADGSAWIEHPAPPVGILALPSWEPTPVFDGLNLLSHPNRQDTTPVITDDGLSFSAATDPGVGVPTGTDVGFFSVDSSTRIHRSVDGVVWSELAAPPTWSKPPVVANDDGEIQHGSVYTHEGRLLAFGIRGDFEGWVGIVDPTTEIWVVDGWTPSNAEVFSFARHDLCEWVSKEVVAAWVARAFDRTGTVTGTMYEPTDDAPGCEWSGVTADADVVTVTVRDASSWRDFGDDPYDFEARMAQAGVTEYEQGPVEIGAWVTGHPALSDGVVVHNGGFGQFAFGVPPGPWLQVTVFSDDWDEDVASAEFEAGFFAVADQFLRALGWAS
jgi:hypothetical protein